MTDLLELSARIIDENLADGPIHRINQQLSELDADLAVVESFSNVICARTGEGLVLFDTSGKFTGEAVRGALRGWASERLEALVYTHGHVDHVGGAGAFVEDARARGDALPRVIGHERVAERFARYRRTNGYNLHVNRRQFGLSLEQMPKTFLPDASPAPDTTFTDRMSLRFGELSIELHHALGETDDHTWAYLPERKAICAGDFMIWNFPNAGNPQKVQRYPLEWAAALRAMAALQPELFLPAHGLPIAGRERIARVLGDTASALESLVDQTLALMNEGATLDAILHEVKLPAELLAKPYLVPRYDEPEFVVRNVWRLYGGWYEGNPARLKPAPDAAVARELAALAGGVHALATRARELSAAGDHRLACHVVELAVQAEPESREAHAARHAVYDARRASERSLMAIGIYGSAARESYEKANPGESAPSMNPSGLSI